MGVLDGLMVLDLGRRYPVSFAAMYLADFGASVVKIDPPAGVTKIKRTELPEEKFAAYLPIDRNKRSVILDLKKEAGRAVLFRLVERADVLVEGFRAGVMDRLGVGYQRLKEVNPRLIYCGLTAFGQSGPYVDAGIYAHNADFLAFAGVMSMIGERNGRPYKPSNLLGDFGAGSMHALVGILLAIIARGQTGRGQLVDIAYVDAAIALNGPNNWELFAYGKPPKRGETRTCDGQPIGYPYRCKDGEWMVVGAPEEHVWANMCRALDREDLKPYYWCRNLDELDMVRRELAAIFETRTRDEWWQMFRELGDKGTCASPVLTVDETFRDPQVLHRNMLLEVAHPVYGSVPQTGFGIKLSETPAEIKHLGVPTGTHTEEVLREAGYAADEIAALRASRVLG